MKYSVKFKGDLAEHQEVKSYLSLNKASLSMRSGDTLTEVGPYKKEYIPALRMFHVNNGPYTIYIVSRLDETTMPFGKGDEVTFGDGTKADIVAMGYNVEHLYLYFNNGTFHVYDPVTLKSRYQRDTRDIVEVNRKDSK